MSSSPNVDAAYLPQILCAGLSAAEGEPFKGIGFDERHCISFACSTRFGRDSSNFDYLMADRELNFLIDVLP
jgi:hypothetical protein